jgi:hypothetical protein
LTDAVHAPPQQMSELYSQWLNRVFRQKVSLMNDLSWYPSVVVAVLGTRVQMSRHSIQNPVAGRVNLATPSKVPATKSNELGGNCDPEAGTARLLKICSKILRYKLSGRQWQQ